MEALISFGEDYLATSSVVAVVSTVAEESAAIEAALEIESA